MKRYDNYKLATPDDDQDLTKKCTICDNLHERNGDTCSRICYEADMI